MVRETCDWRITNAVLYNQLREAELRDSGASVSDTWERVKHLLHAAWQLDPAQRTAYLDEACADEPEIRSEIDTLLARDVKAADFLEPPAAVLNSSPFAEEIFIGSRVGPYQIVEEIGRGGMGLVYAAERADGHYRKRVAVKVISAHGGDTQMLQRFRQERQALADLTHPNIARLLDGGATEDGTPYLVMDYVDGDTLADRIAQGPMPATEALHIAAQIANALQAAHDKGIVHRDLKPANVKITPEGAVVVLDFGLAKLTRASAVAYESSPDVAYTEAGIILGTPAYMAPEQGRGQAVDKRADIWAFGVILFEMLTGKQPFSGGCAAEVVAAAITQKPDLQAVPEPLRRLLAGCLDKDPQKRLQNVGDWRRLVNDSAEPSKLAGATFISAMRRRPVLASAVAGMLVITAVVLAAAFALGSRMVDRYRNGFEPASIAVLPFTDMTPERNQEYFSDGLAEELLNALAEIPGVRVSARTSAFQFKSKTEDCRAIGKKLKVATLLEGSVRKQGNRALISIHLIDAASGSSLWSNSFDRDLSDILAVEQEISRAVAGALKIALLPARTRTVAMSRTSASSFNEYLQGRYFLMLGNKEALEKAVGYFARAINMDPKYAPAWASLAMARNYQAGAGYIEDGYEAAKAATQRALELNPDLPDGLAALGWIQMAHEWNWSGAHASYTKALALAPGNASVIVNEAALARFQGRLDGAIALYRRALDLDPLNPITYFDCARSLYYAGRQKEALAALNTALDLAPDMASAHTLLGQVYLALSSPERALIEMQKEKHPAFRLYGLALVYHSLGQTNEADVSLARLIAEFHDAAPFQIAEVYGFRGDNERTFEWLEKAYNEPDPGLCEMKNDPLLSRVQRDPRYLDMLNRLRL